MSNIASKGAVNLVNNQFHVGRAARDTFSSKSLESMGKSAFASAITAGLTQGAGFDGDMSKMQGGELYKTIAGRALIKEAVSTAIEVGDPSRIAERVAASTAIASIQHKIGDIGIAKGYQEGSMTKGLMHGMVGGTFSEVRGGNFAIGATGSFAGEMATGYIQPETQAGKGAVGLVSSTAAMAIGGKAKDMNLASDVSQSAVEHNLWGHAVKKVLKKLAKYGGKKAVKNTGKKQPGKSLMKNNKKGDKLGPKSSGSKKPHGNSKEYVGDTHVYSIQDSKSNQVFKIGESMQGYNKLGLSKRAEEQVRRAQRHTGAKMRSKVRRTFKSKSDARQYETNLIQRFRKVFGQDKLPGNKGSR